MKLPERGRLDTLQFCVTTANEIPPFLRQIIVTVSRYSGLDLRVMQNKDQPTEDGERSRTLSGSHHDLRTLHWVWSPTEIQSHHRDCIP